MIARTFRRNEIFPAREIAPEAPDRIVPMTGARRVVPQVGQPEPRTTRPATMAEDSRPSLVFLLCLATKKTRAIKDDCRKIKQKFKSQSEKDLLTPKIARKADFITLSAPRKLPDLRFIPIKPNEEKPLESKLMRVPKIRKVKMNGGQKDFLREARRKPLAASKNSSHHLASWSFIRLFYHAGTDRATVDGDFISPGGKARDTKDEGFEACFSLEINNRVCIGVFNVNR